MVGLIPVPEGGGHDGREEDFAGEIQDNESILFYLRSR